MRCRKTMLTAGLIIVVAGIAIFIRLYQNRSNPYRGTKAYVSMAGRGDPWPQLTAKRRLLLRCLHDGYSPERVAEILRLPGDRILSELRALEDVGLVAADCGWYRPTFFIANRDETERVYTHAKVTGQFLAEELLSRWSELEQSFSTLSLSQTRSLADVGFMLVGGRILDIGMLWALVEDGTVLPLAPSRPTREHPNGRYYLWMVEGDLEHLGRYGQDDTDLPRANWHLLTFAQNVVSRRRNPARSRLDKKCRKLIDANPEGSPEFFARNLSVDFMSRADSHAWATVTQRISTDLALIAQYMKACVWPRWRTEGVSRRSLLRNGPYKIPIVRISKRMQARAECTTTGHRRGLQDSVLC